MIDTESLAAEDNSDDAVKELLQYVDSVLITGNRQYVEGLVDQIIAKAVEGTRQRLVRRVWAGMVTPGPGMNERYIGGWNDSVAASTDAIQGAYLNTCATCQKPIGYIQSPHEMWWAHETHPADNHDAVPIR